MTQSEGAWRALWTLANGSLELLDDHVMVRQIARGGLEDLDASRTTEEESLEVRDVPPPDDGVVLKDPWTGTWKLPRWVVRLFGG